MSEQKIMRKVLIKNMIINFITFTVLFSIFDLIIYNQVASNLYKTIDEELVSSKAQYERQLKRITNTDVIGSTSTDSKQQNTPTRPNSNMDLKISPRLIFIARDENGNITNEDTIGRFYEDYVSEVGFNKNLIEEVYSLNINYNQYSYRAYNFTTTDSEGNFIYVQVLANVDGEAQTLRNIYNTLAIGTCIIVIFVIIASYILSKRTIKPIIASWKKQTEFVQNASHELRTPLTIIQAKQEILLQNPNEKIIDKSEDINISLKETRRLTKLIKELMILARSDSDKYELNKEDTDIDKLIKEITIPYKDFVETQDKKIELDLKYGKEIKVDRSKINQLLVIVLDNSIKYTSDGEKIEVKTYSKDGKCNMEISDTGIGISDEALKHIFDRFYREDKARSRETGGNGLGLSIAKTIVTAHGGTIKVAHNEPKGTKIIIKI